MRSQPRGFRALTLAAAVIAVLFVAPSVASADTGDIIAPQNEPPTAADGFQAGTCEANGVWPNQCSPETPLLIPWETAAGGHPNIGFTQYIVKQTIVNVEGTDREIPLGSVATIRVDLPAGLTINPEATPVRCTMEEFEEEPGPAQPTNCPAASQIGEEEITLKVIAGPGTGTIVPPVPFVTDVPMYNVEPKFGEPARFGFKVGEPGTRKEVFLEGDVAWDGDYHQGFTIHLPTASPGTRTWKSRLVNFGKAGDGSYISNPTTCFDPATGAYEAHLRAQKVGEESPNFPVGFTPFPAALPEGVEQTDCDTVPFDPSLDVKPGTDQVDSPAAPEVKVELPFEPNPEGQEQSHVRNSSIAFPPGMGLNPSAANGLGACTDAQFGEGTRNPVNCPPNSVIGTAEVETQALPPGSLKGAVYLAQQQGFNPESGQMFRVFFNPKSDRYDVDVRLTANVKANAQTGQLTAVLSETPQVPFESVTLKLDPAKQTMTSPPTCGPNQTTSAMEPWARPGTTENPSSSFTLSKAPGGGACPQTLADRPFGPSYDAGPVSYRAGQFSPLGVKIERPDGAQEIRQANVTLPPGMVARLRNVQYCSEDAIAAAANKPGREVLATPACPNSSWVGGLRTLAGSGGNPLQVLGNVYLAGPYKGAPLSMAFITPAVAGPFDLGTLVVRAAIHVDPETAVVTAVSDTIPDVFGGVKLSIREIEVTLTRKNFSLNPTTCREPFAIQSTLFGGGANPADPAAWSQATPSVPFQASKCRNLKFQPKFFARIFGGKNQMNRNKNPKFRAILEARNGDANIRRAAFTLPRAVILDQSHIRTICTRVQLANNNCPKGAIYGHARATSPLLKNQLRGPVYLTSSSNELPDLLVDLRGQVNVRLRGVISGAKARLKTVFRTVPDVAVSKFILTMKGGNQGLLVNSRNLCSTPTNGFLNLRAQNSRRLKDNQLRLNIPACRGGQNR